MQTIVVRADGNSLIGMGHIMRCIGLAHAFLEKGFDIVFLLGVDSPPVTERLRHEHLDYFCGGQGIANDLDSQFTSAFCNDKNASLLLIDGYEYNTLWLKSLELLNTKVMLWTDYLQAESLPIDIILDQTAAATPVVYREAAPTATLLCGLEYAVLRTEFLHNTSLRRERKSIQNVLVTMGGSDPNGVTLIALEAIRRLPVQLSTQFSTRVIVGPANQFSEQINALVAKMDGCAVYSSVTNMSEFLAWADIAIAAAGTSVWEFAYAGLPAITTSIADNQIALGQAVEAFGGGIDMGLAADLDIDKYSAALAFLLERPEQLTSMSANMLAQVDGDGAKRVVERVQAILAGLD